MLCFLFFFVFLCQFLVSWTLPYWSYEFRFPTELTDWLFNKISFDEWMLKIDPEQLAIMTSEQIATYYDLAMNLGFDMNNIDPEAYMNVNDIIRYHGYHVEEYTVITKDGYVLTIQRIPYGKDGPGNARRKPVLVQHGILASSAIWVTNTADKNLPYLLADAGYDVWLGNIRGTTFGKKNVYMKPEDKEFWAFSFDEMAEFDLPAVIDTILNETGFQHIYYVGHSMGTSMMFALLSTQPQYNKIIKGFFALAPVAKVAHMRSPIRYLAPFSGELKWLLYAFGKKGEFLPNDSVIKFFARTVCNSPLRVFCENVLFILCGYDEIQLNATRLPVYMFHTPDSTSVQNVVHYAQMIQSQKFQYQDFGREKNQQKYNQPTPPEYDLTRVTAPTALFWASNDYLSDPGDVGWLALKLPNVVLKYHVPFAQFAHLDFIWAIDVKPLLYDKLLDVMGKMWKEQN